MADEIKPHNQAATSPEPTGAHRKQPRLRAIEVKRARASLEKLLDAGKLTAKSPAMRRLKQIERPWRAQLGTVAAGTASALRVAATQQLLLERLDNFVLHELPHPANRHKRALHAVTKERQLIADRLLQMLEGLGLVCAPVATNNTELARAFAEAFACTGDPAPPPQPAPVAPVPLLVLPAPAPPKSEPEPPPAPSPPPELLPRTSPLPQLARDVTPPSQNRSTFWSGYAGGPDCDERAIFFDWYRKL